MPASVVSVSIDKQTASISRTGFGTPLIMSAEADGILGNTAKVYGSVLSELTDDGFDPDGTTAAKFTALISQNPKIPQIVVGKRSNLPLMTMILTPIAQDSTLYRVTVKGANAGVLTGSTDFDYTSDGTALVAEITAGLAAAMDQTAWITATGYVVGDYVSSNGRAYICTVAGTSAVAPSGVGSAIADGTVTWAHKGPEQNINATDNTTTLTVEKAASPGGAGTAGATFSLEADRALLTSQNTTADPGLSADLGYIRGNADGNDDWYAVFLDSYGKAEIEGLATVVETTSKIFLASTSDADVLTAVDTDVGSVLQSNTYARTAYMWHETPGIGPEAAWAGRALPLPPGSISWNLLSNIAGVPASTLSTAERVFLEGKNGNYFVELASLTVPKSGAMAGGEWIDVTRGIDFVVARLQENIFLKLVNLNKVPFTDAGIAVIENEVIGVMSLAVSQGIFTGDPAPLVTVPRANDVDVNDRANRFLPDVNFSAQLAGAIHTVEVNGVVTV